MCVMIGLNGDRHPGLDITQAKRSLNTIIVVDVCFFFSYLIGNVVYLFDASIIR